MANILQSPTGAPETAEDLRQRIGSMANRVRIIGTVDALCWSLAILVAGLVLVAWMDIIWQLPFGLRRVVVPLALLLTLLVFAWLFWKRWTSAASDQMARRMDKAAGTGGQILSGWDLLHGDKSASTAPHARLSRGIASVAIGQASQRASEVDAKHAAPWNASRTSLLVAIGVGSVTTLFAIFASHAFGTSWERLINASDTTPPYSPLVFEVSPGDVQLTYGQPLEVTATISGGAVEDAMLVLGDPENPDANRVSMFPRGSNQWQAVLPRVTEPVSYCVATGRGRSEAFHVEILQTPEIESVNFVLTPPTYTGLPKRKGRYPQDRIDGLLNTEVAFEINANRPLAKGTLRLEPVGDAVDRVASDPQSHGMKVLQVAPENNLQVSGVISIERSGQWRLSVTGENGVSSQWPVALEIDLLIDQPPIARIVQPRSRSYATPDTEIPVAVVGEDDYGISRMRLYRILDGSRPIPIDLPVESSRRMMQGNSSLPLAAFGLRPGDKITMFARVDDTRPDIAQGGESPLTKIEIISQRDFDRLVAARQGQQMLENKFRQARRMMDRLATELAELQKEIDESDEKDADQQRKLKERLSQLRQKMKEVADELQRLAEQPLPLELDEHWSKLLREQAVALRQAAAKCQAMDQGGKTAKQQAEELKQQLNRIRQQQDQQFNQPLETLRKVAPLIVSESKFVQLVARQRFVVDQLDRFRKQDSIRDEADRQQIIQRREEESAIRRALSDLMDEIESHAKLLGDDPDLQDLQASSLEFVAAVRASQIGPELSAARKSLAGFNGSDGYAHALSALEEMERFLSQCRSNSQKAGQCLKKKFAPGLPKQGAGSLSQMLAQMGLNSGSGSGYSMRGNTGQNVGLYGNQPFAQRSGSGQGEDGRMSPARGERSVGAGDADSDRGLNMELPAAARSGARDVPLRYRKQAEIYLRRLAEQMERPGQ